MALDLPYKLWTFFTIKSSLFAREYQHADMQSLTHWITLEPLSTNFNRPLQHTRKSMRRKHKLSLRTDDSIEETITMTAIAVTTAATPCTTATDRDHVALYAIRKDVAHGNILGRNKKSLKPSSELPTETDLANSTTDLRNDSTNILWIMRMTIPT